VNKTKTLASLLVAGSCLACGGSSPPRPAASAAAPESADLKPIGTREAQAAPSLPPGHPAIAPGATAGPAADQSAGRVAGTVLLSPKLAAGPGDVLYLIAKQGATTLAVRRIDKPVFPFEFELTGADAMVSGVPFVGPVDLVARLSRTGDAIPAKGDLEGVTKGVAVPASGVKIAIDTTRP
jgi:cytochrome c-type biogenesis protein CcmH